jgi:hypothetical protein
MPLALAWFIFGAGALFFILFFAGAFSRDGQRGSGAPSEPSPGEDCTQACASLRQAHDEVCRRRAELDTLIRRRDADALLLRDAQIVAAAILVSAIAASVIPLIGLLLAGPLWAAYVVAQATVVVLLGRVAGNSGPISQAEMFLTQSTGIKTTATQALRDRCPNDQAEQCIRSLPPC